MLRDLAANLRRRHVTVSIQNAKSLAKAKGLVVLREGKTRWYLARPDGLGHPVLYHHLAELVSALAAE